MSLRHPLSIRRFPSHQLDGCLSFVFSARTTVMAPYGRLAEGFSIVYSTTFRESFEEVTTFYQHILRYSNKDIFSVILVASKCDLEPKREVGIHGASLPRPHTILFRLVMNNVIATR